MSKEIEAIRRFRFESKEELIEYFEELECMLMDDEPRPILVQKYGLSHKSQVGGVWVNEWGGWLFEIMRIDSRFYVSKTFNEKVKEGAHQFDGTDFFKKFSLDEIYMMVLPNEDGMIEEQ